MDANNCFKNSQGSLRLLRPHPNRQCPSSVVQLRLQPSLPRTIGPTTKTITVTTTIPRPWTTLILTQFLISSTTTTTTTDFAPHSSTKQATKTRKERAICPASALKGRQQIRPLKMWEEFRRIFTILHRHHLLRQGEMLPPKMRSHPEVWPTTIASRAIICRSISGIPD